MKNSSYLLGLFMCIGLSSTWAYAGNLEIASFVQQTKISVVGGPESAAGEIVELLATKKITSIQGAEVRSLNLSRQRFQVTFTLDQNSSADFEKDPFGNIIVREQ